MPPDDAPDRHLPMRLTLGLLVVAAVAALAWWQRAPLQTQLRAWGLNVPTLAGSVGLPAPSAAPARPSARKCVGPSGAVVYTNAACPSGHHEQTLDGGSLTVLPATPVPAPAPAASARPLLRQLAPDADGPTIRERMADRLP